MQKIFDGVDFEVARDPVLPAGRRAHEFGQCGGTNSRPVSVAGRTHQGRDVAGRRRLQHVLFGNVGFDHGRRCRDDPGVGWTNQKEAIAPPSSPRSSRRRPPSPHWCRQHHPVVYGAVGNVSIAGLFMAGVVPGMMIGFGLMIYCYFWAHRHAEAAPAARPAPPPRPAPAPVVRAAPPPRPAPVSWPAPWPVPHRPSPVRPRHAWRPGSRRRRVHRHGSRRPPRARLPRSNGPHRRRGPEPYRAASAERATQVARVEPRFQRRRAAAPNRPEPAPAAVAIASG